MAGAPSDQATAAAASSSMSPPPPPPPSSTLRPLRHVYTAHDPHANTAVFTKIRRGDPTPRDGGRLAVDDVYAASTLSGAPGRVLAPGGGGHPHFHHHDDDDGYDDGNDGDDARESRQRSTTCGVLSAGVASPGGGTVCRVVDIAPGHECMTHRGSSSSSSSSSSLPSSASLLPCNGDGGRAAGPSNGVVGVRSSGGVGGGGSDTAAMNIDYAIVVDGEITLRLDSGAETVLGRGDVAVQRAGRHTWRNDGGATKDAWARMVLVLQDCRAPAPSFSSSLASGGGGGTMGVDWDAGMRFR
ncbi:hypothetical protein JDV02_009667 [Purpureocillium takamizusanense]|uniref:Uncharacterized protein n=1 Tax=Purpureocillium takamizusanense TaxID=2060973 RepID=A0A9Q8QMG4_9HYPO|nr:uncharacterized protein JDV02_009667 [Purpureocillium takamizusanense]UNI23874.1 hypothetical protein JDV02_009667 [Purpureocillium takamizusanense]